MRARLTISEYLLRSRHRIRHLACIISGQFKVPKCYEFREVLKVSWASDIGTGTKRIGMILIGWIGESNWGKEDVLIKAQIAPVLQAWGICRLALQTLFSKRWDCRSSLLLDLPASSLSLVPPTKTTARFIFLKPIQVSPTFWKFALCHFAFTNDLT